MWISWSLYAPFGEDLNYILEARSRMSKGGLVIKNTAQWCVQNSPTHVDVIELNFFVYSGRLSDLF